MATLLYLTNRSEHGITGTGDGLLYDMSTTAGTAADTCVTDTTTSGTQIQWTKTSGGSTVAWISGPAPAGGFTLTEADISLWQHESNMNNNAGGRFRVFKRTAAGTITEIGGGPWNDGVEMNTAAREDTWPTSAMTDTAFAENDRIILRAYVTNVGTMAAASSGATLTFNAPAGQTGDSFFNIAETVTFKTPSLDQDSYRFRNDDGSETTATWRAAINTTANLNLDTNYRLRFLVQNAGTLVRNDVDFEFQYNRNGAGWNNITTSSTVVRAFASANYVDGDDCTQQLGSGTFHTNNDGMTEDGISGGVNLDLAAAAETETELCFQVRSADVANGDTIQFRLTRDGGIPLDTYTRTPSITIGNPAMATLTDNFNDNTRDTAKWNLGTINAFHDTNVTALEQNGRLEITVLTSSTGENYNGYKSANVYDLTNSAAYVEVVQATQSNNTRTTLIVGSDNNNWVHFIQQGASLYGERVFAATYAFVFGITYSPTNHRFWRIRHDNSDDTFRFDTSPDGTTWTQQSTHARGMTVTGLNVAIQAGNFGTNAVTPTAIFDNFNVIGPAVLTPGGIATGQAFGTLTIFVQGALTPTGIATGQAFGTAAVRRTIHGTGIASTEAIGTAAVHQRISVTGIATGQAFGTTTLSQAGAVITPTGITSGEAFPGGSAWFPEGWAPDGWADTAGGAIVTVTAPSVQPSAIASGQAFGTATVSVQSGAQTISPSGIATGQAFGTATLSLRISPSGMSSTEAFGTASLRRTIAPSSIASTAAVGLPQLNQALTPTGIATGQAFGTATLTRGAVTISLTGIASTESVSQPVVQSGVTFITATGIATGQAFGTAVLRQSLAANSIASAEAFGTLTLRLSVLPNGITTGEAVSTPQLNQAVAVTGIATGQAFGTITLTRGAVSVSLTGIASTEAVGQPLVNIGALILLPSGIASGQAFGTATLTVKILPSGIATTAALGTPVLRFTLSPTGIASTEAWGSLTIRVSLSATGIASGETFGSVTVARGVVTVQPSGIATGQAFGTAVLGIFGFISPAGITSGEAFGTATLHQQLLMSGIPSAQAFGTLILIRSLRPVAIGTAEAHGTPTLVRGVRVIPLTGIPSAEAFGTGAVVPDQFVTPQAIPTGEVIGTAALGQYVRPPGLPTVESFGTPALHQRLLMTGIASGELWGTAFLNTGEAIIFASGIPTGQAFGVQTVATAPPIPFVIISTPGRQMLVTVTVGNTMVSVSGRGQSVNVPLSVPERNMYVAMTSRFSNVLVPLEVTQVTPAGRPTLVSVPQRTAV